MVNILVGSRAWNAQVPKEYQIPNAKDWDIITDDPDIQSVSCEGGRVEVSCLDFLNNKDIVLTWYTIDTPVGEARLPLTWDLIKIKRSHLWRPYFWNKHITHYWKYMIPFIGDDLFHSEDSDLADYNILTQYITNNNFTRERAKLTKEFLKQGNPNLKQSNEDFFDDPVEKVFDHDWIHELVAHYDRPIYMDMKRDYSLAWCERDMWDQFPLEKKIKCVQEEAYVIALERFIIPHHYLGGEFHSYGASYCYAVQKICTTLTSGWFRDFAIDHWPMIMESYDKTKLPTIFNIIKGEKI